MKHYNDGNRGTTKCAPANADGFEKTKTAPEAKRKELDSSSSTHNSEIPPRLFLKQGTKSADRERRPTSLRAVLNS
jgi:hypothetical protein